MTPSLHDIATLDRRRSRSISPENPDGAVSGGGRATRSEFSTPEGGPYRDLGRGWKVRPFVDVAAGEVFDLADIDGPGTIESIWMTTAKVANRDVILRIYWDDQHRPSVECPLGDFFASAYTGYDVFAQVSSLPICVNPGNAYNCYWPMPFRGRCRMTIENRNPATALRVFYQVNYALGPVSDDAAYFHAQFRRVNPLPEKRVYTVLDGVRGRGRYVGTYMAWQVNSNGWWGEGEIKFYLDGDIPEGESIDDAVAEHGGSRFPTICGTGTEDYFCGSYNFENKAEDRYQEFSTAYAGMPHVVRPDGLYASNTRFSLYRWHLPDPVRFADRIAVTIQAMGWQDGGRYLPLRDDIASVAYWYQTLPTAPFPALSARDALRIN